MSFQIDITEKDYREALGDAYVEATFSNRDIMSSGGVQAAVLDELPKVIAARLGRMIPSGFSVKEICMRVEFSGKVFGCGASGEVSFTFAPEK